MIWPQTQGTHTQALSYLRRYRQAPTGEREVICCTHSLRSQSILITPGYTSSQATGAFTQCSQLVKTPPGLEHRQQYITPKPPCKLSRCSLCHKHLDPNIVHGGQTLSSSPLCTANADSLPDSHSQQPGPAWQLAQGGSPRLGETGRRVQIQRQSKQHEGDTPSDWNPTAKLHRLCGTQGLDVG
jgi:hypothetical protein